MVSRSVGGFKPCIRILSSGCRQCVQRSRETGVCAELSIQGMAQRRGKCIPIVHFPAKAGVGVTQIDRDRPAIVTDMLLATQHAITELRDQSLLFGIETTQFVRRVSNPVMQKDRKQAVAVLRSGNLLHIVYIMYSLQHKKVVPFFNGTSFRS